MVIMLVVWVICQAMTRLHLEGLTLLGALVTVNWALLGIFLRYALLTLDFHLMHHCINNLMHRFHPQ